MDAIHNRSVRFAALFVAVLMLGAASPCFGSAASLATEVEQGQELAAALGSGEKECSELSADDFELIGEFAMGRYLGSESIHAAMNRRMTRVMGGAGERRMHIALGYRYSGCSGGPAAGWVGPMAGMMGGSLGYRPGMMGEGGFGRMMSFGHHGDDDDIGLATVVLIGLGSAALGAGIAYMLLRGRATRRG